MNADDGRDTVLVVDDDPGSLLAIGAVLEGADFRVVTARCGEAALKAVLRAPPSLIVLDLVMPGMSGLEVAELLKGRERSRRVPIVFLTGASAAGEEEPARRAYSAGAVDYLQKPVEPDVLRAKVASLAALYRRGEEERARAEGERQAREAEVSALRSSSERRYRNLAEAIPAIVWTAEPDGRLSYANRRLRETTGQEPDLAAGWLELLHPDDRDRFARAWEGALVERRPFAAEARLRRAGGGWRWHLWRAVPEATEQAGVVAWLGTAMDIDDQKRTHAELAGARARAEGLYEQARRAVEVREEFVSVAGHELRTPLAALQLQVQVLGRRLEALPAPEGADLVRRAGRLEQLVGRLARLVEQLLDVNRLADQRLRLAPEEVDLAALAREVAARMEEEAARAGARVVVEAPGSLRGRWDPLRLEQVLVNLLSNAVKYGAGRPVTVTVAERGGVATVSVRDEGLGISAEDQRRIFDRFERAVPANQYGGLGLGLWITREIVRAHGGEVRVDSQPGVGATFTVALPLAAEPVAGRRE
ncbi:MAG: ATP-binding protein [Planctomycetes bacterium]|nr:ATP-binding protein [Planctomycetota bacterium]